MIKWARREVEIVLQQLTQRQPITDYDRKCYTAALEAFEFLCKQGHSGYSFAETFKILTRLCNKQPLCYINVDDFVDKHPEFRGLAETIQKAQEEIGRLIMNYVEQMKEIENKIIAISGETPEQMEELRINAIKEIANQLESAGERHRC